MPKNRIMPQFDGQKQLTSTIHNDEDRSIIHVFLGTKRSEGEIVLSLSLSLSFFLTLFLPLSLFLSLSLARPSPPPVIKLTGVARSEMSFEAATFDY